MNIIKRRDLKGLRRAPCLLGVLILFVLAWLSTLAGLNPFALYQKGKLIAVYEPDSSHPLTIYTLIASGVIALLASFLAGYAFKREKQAKV